MFSFNSAFSSLKEATGLLTKFNQIKTEAEVAQKTIELSHTLTTLQNELISAQSAYSSAIGRINDLENELVQLKNWAADKQRYQLRQTNAGANVYVLQPEMANGEPIHSLCPNCYQQNIKSILQPLGFRHHASLLYCPRCQSEYPDKPTGTGRAINLPDPTFD